MVHTVAFRCVLAAIVCGALCYELNMAVSIESSDIKIQRNWSSCVDSSKISSVVGELYVVGKGNNIARLLAFCFRSTVFGR